MRVHEAAKRLGVSHWAVRQYCNNGELDSNRTPGNQRNITEDQLKRFMIKKGMIQEDNPKTAFYVRSTSGDTKLIQAQIDELTQEYGEPNKIYKDSSSGLNENRKGLWRLIQDIEDGKYDRICITYQDRLTRFGYSYIEHICERSGTSIAILHDKKKYSIEQELMDDFMSLIASFSGRFYRMRGTKEQKQLLADANERLDHGKQEE